VVVLLVMTLDRDELSLAFETVHDTNQRAMSLRIAVVACGTVLVALLAFWGASGMLQTLASLSSGFARFGKGDFRSPIPITTKDELALVAREANQMAVYPEDDGGYQLRASHAGPVIVEEVSAATRIAEGEGLVGQAMLSGELTIIDELPSDYLKIRSALGEIAPRQLLIVPLVHFGHKAGALELGLREPLSEARKELLPCVRNTYLDEVT
jgi:GAF domain-containing protein